MIRHDESETEPTETMALRADLIRVPIPTATLPPATRTNSYLVGRDGQWMIVDVGGEDHHKALQPLFDAVDRYAGGRIDGVLITHEHPDHHAGLQVLASHFAGVPVFAHPHVIARIADDYTGVRWTPANDGDEWRGLVLMLTEGHARGHLSVVGRDFVLCGDMMSGIGTIVVAPPDGDMSAYFASLERLVALGERACLPAHGGASPSVAARARAYLQHRKARERKIYRALSDRSTRSLAEVTALAYDDVPETLHVIAAQSALAHLQKLAHEERARCTDGAWQKC